MLMLSKYLYNFRMDSINYSAVRAALARTLERVCEDHDPVIVTRQGRPSVVILSLEDYESLTETADLLRSPTNARRLLDAIDELNAGKGRERTLDDEVAVRDPSLG